MSRARREAVTAAANVMASSMSTPTSKFPCSNACGYALANKGHDTRAIQGWLGHRSITSTAVYTALAPNRFKDFWRE
jgi:site-specific recombinase XerD